MDLLQLVDKPLSAKRTNGVRSGSVWNLALSNSSKYCARFR